jgi:Sensors of blue-light using FAD
MCTTILNQSRHNNAIGDITGLLVAGHKRFLQALEGPAAEVRRTYAQIAADDRHYACVLLGEREIDQRQFGDWAMGYSAGGSEPDDDSDLEALVATMVAPVPDPNLRAQFNGFAALQARAPEPAASPYVSSVSTNA